MNNSAFITNTARAYNISLNKAEKIYKAHCDCKGVVRYQEYYEEIKRVKRQRSEQGEI